MDEVDRAITKFDNSVIVYDTSQLISVGDASRRGSSTFAFNWRSPLGLLQRKRRESMLYTVMTRDAQMESVIFDFTFEADIQHWFSELQLSFLDDLDDFKSMLSDGEEQMRDKDYELDDFGHAVSKNNVAIDKETRDSGRSACGNGEVRSGTSASIFDSITPSIRVNAADVLPSKSQSEEKPVTRPARRGSLNPVSWWRY